jgi:hypothetical protein
MEKPFFFYYTNKIYALYDVPHLIKCLRNIWRDHDLIQTGEDTIVSWNDVVRFFKLEQEAGTTGVRAAPKLSDKHLNLGPFAKMSVKLAKQVFSHSVKAGMVASSMSGNLKGETVMETAMFIGRVNDIFDSLNSRHPNDTTPHRQPLRDTPYNKPAECLKQAQKWIPIWSLANKKPNPPTFSGLQQSINTILLLWDDLKVEGMKYLLTTRLNQDPNENSFAVMRNRSG